MCLNPIYINIAKQPGVRLPYYRDNLWRKVPCGKCQECKSMYQQQWVVRINEELKKHDYKAVFFTLTYDDKSVPINYLYNGSLYRSPVVYNYDTDSDRIRHEHFYQRGPLKGTKAVWYTLPRGMHPHKRVSPTFHLDAVKVVDSSSIISYNRKYYEKQKIWFPVSVPSNVNSFGSAFSEFDESSFGAEFLCSSGLSSSCSVNPLASLPPSPDPFNGAVIRFNSVRVGDVQWWLKRSFTRLSRAGISKPSYWITSEYGPNTRRPHYHGLMIGVNAKEFRQCFNDWKDRFGKECKCEDYNPLKGGAKYVAKYCSKGFFEHELCSKSFCDPRTHHTVFGPHYYNCLKYFGVDFPIVDPTFHLVSIGFGDTDDMFNFVRDKFHELDEVVSSYSTKVYTRWLVYKHPSKTTRWITENHRHVRVPNPPELHVKLFKWVSLIPDIDYEFVKKWQDSFKYSYNFKRRKGNSSSSNVYSDEVRKLPLPQYYLKKYCTDAERSKISNYLRGLSDVLLLQEYQLLAAEHPDWSYAEVACAQASNEKAKLDLRADLAFRWSKQFYSNSRL